jgi:dipeptidyl aminopeptidase/acylaminoacyl peptidase
MVRPHRPVATFVASVLFILCLMAGATPVMAACENLLPSPGVVRQATRSITPDDLLRLRDIGQPDGSMFGQPSPFGISPDGREAAFILNRADPDTNSYCRALVVISLSGPPNPRILDRGGEMITNSTVARGLVVDIGFPALLTPAWSRDGRWIAYLRRDHGITQAWRARADGSEAEVVTRSPVDVEAVAWTSDGRRIVYVAQPGQDGARRRIAEEGRGGWLYDARFAPNVAARPLIPGSAPREAFMIDPTSGEISSAGPAERSLVPIEDQSGSSIAPSAVSPDGRRAWTERSDASPLSLLRLVATDRSGRRVTCMAAACGGGFTGLWWDVEGNELRFLRREGWANGQMGLYRWRPGEGAPRRVLLTDDVLLGCTPADGGLLCTSENAVTPRQLVSVDPASGHVRPVYDPNPEFGTIRLGKVERLRWRNDLGLEAWGDLVLPPDYRPGTKLPMIVVQYHSDGFLRGGTGDEYPIHAFAARGFAVLSIERPAFVAQGRPGIRSYDDVNAANGKGWAERRSLLSSLVTGVNMVIARGIADSARIGITGLSDGASTARFALINTRMFAAAAISTCCVEPKSIMTYGGIAYADAMRAMGYPPATRDDPDFWRPYSIALNARAMDRPLLMQLADEEYLLGLETFTALREAGQPVEMYVYPGEHHIKWQPAHRRAIYERNLDWFQFWLQSHVDPDPAKAAQYSRWEAMRKPNGRGVAPS